MVGGPTVVVVVGQLVTAVPGPLLLGLTVNGGSLAVSGMCLAEVVVAAVAASAASGLVGLVVGGAPGRAAP